MRPCKRSTITVHPAEYSRLVEAHPTGVSVDVNGWAPRVERVVNLRVIIATQLAADDVAHVLDEGHVKGRGERDRRRE